jgi:hypothetical protein
VRTKKPVLWTVLHHTRSLVGLKQVGRNGLVLPMFSSPFAAEAWIMGMKFEQHFCSPPLWPVFLREILEVALVNGFEGYVLNPPPSMKTPMEIADIENLLDQVEAKL